VSRAAERGAEDEDPTREVDNDAELHLHDEILRRAYDISAADALKRLDPASKQRVLERLRRILADHHCNGGVWFDARAWIVTARRA
jgi:hypothetical protein